jgi:hypothetical protein
LWVDRAKGQRLDRVDFSDRPGGTLNPLNRTPAATEGLVLDLRKYLKEQSDLGEYGAAAIRRSLLDRGEDTLPSIRTIGRILERRGALDGRVRLRFPPPPPGWYLPDLVKGRAELDAFDIVESLVIKGGTFVEVLNGISLFGGLPDSWPEAQMSSKTAGKCLVLRWRDSGLPDFAQFDNDTAFQGSHARPDTFGRITRLCLSLGVTPVFAPPRETGFQAAIESFNDRWQRYVWRRFQHESLPALQVCSAKYIVAVREKLSARISQAPARRPFPSRWTFDLQAPLRGRVIFIRRTGETGALSVLGHVFCVDRNWTHRLVRCEVLLNELPWPKGQGFRKKA